MNFIYGSIALAMASALIGLAVLPLGLSMATELSLWCVAAMVLLGLVPGRTARLLFLTVCSWVIVRYIGWRMQTLPLDGSWLADAGAVALLGGELYGVSMLLLGLFVNAFPLERQVQPLPADVHDYPTVDIYIPTYSEPLSVVAPTVMAAVEIDYPRDKLRVYVLDDGWPRSQNPNTDPQTAHELAERTRALQALCTRHGAVWLSRERNEHAKSGNMNSAMLHTHGEFILILDADHVPTRDILRNTVGTLLADKKLAFVQTPHYFSNQDPVEKNLDMFGRMPGENDMFYRVVQKGLDLWNTSFFCGSAALLRREAIADVGGFSVDSITEDASTSVKMHQKGWRSAYLGIPMVAGLQPETFAGFTVQRLRWGMGMMQIFIKQNPLLIKGLSPAQRVSYLSIIMFWLFPFARVTFFIAPFLSVFLNLTVYPIGLEYFYAYTAPYLLAIVLHFDKTFGRVRQIVISEVYETLQAFYMLPALISTALRPNAPTFKVTPKGEKLDREYISEFKTPFYAFYALTVVGLVWGLGRMLWEPEARAPLVLSVTWLFFNFALLSASLGVLLEKPQRRHRPRVRVGETYIASGSFGTKKIEIIDATETCVRAKTLDGSPLGPCSLTVNGVGIPAKPVEVRDNLIRAHEQVLEFQLDSPEQERAAVLLGYGSSKRWNKQWQERESRANFLMAALTVFMVALRHGGAHIRKLLKASSAPRRTEGQDSE